MAADVTADVLDIYKALADATRLRLVGLLAERPRSGDDLAALLGVSPPTVSHHLARLKAAGLVRGARDGPFVYYALNLQRFHQVSRALFPTAALPRDERARTVATFFAGDRLLRLPSSEKRLIWILEEIVTRFRPGRVYTEREVNAVLRPILDDVASLRRALVDHRLMHREADRYSRPER